MTASTQHTESAERIARPLIQLAKINGISTSYIDQLGTYVEIRDEVLVSVLAALDVDASTAQAITDSYAEARQRIADTLIPTNRCLPRRAPHANPAWRWAWAPYRTTYAPYLPIMGCLAAWWNGSRTWMTPPTPGILMPIPPRTASMRWHPSPHTTCRRLPNCPPANMPTNTSTIMP